MRRSERLFIACLGLFLLAYGLLTDFNMHWGNYGAGDYIAYWSVPRGLLWGKGFFDLPWLKAIQNAHGYNQTQGYDWAGVYHYFPVMRLWNPPPILALLLPLGGLDLGGSILLWIGLSTLLYAQAASLMNRTQVVRLPDVIALLLPLVFLPFFISMALGQVSPLLGALLVFAWHLQRQGHHAATGVLLVPMLLKPHLLFIAQALLVVVALRRRAWMTLATAIGLSALLVLIAFLLEPDWVNKWRAQGAPIDWQTFSLWDLAQFQWHLPSWFQFVGVLLFGGLAVWRYRSVTVVTPRLLAESTLLSFLGSPYAWSHDITVLLPTVLWIAGTLWQRGPRILLIPPTLLFAGLLLLPHGLSLLVQHLLQLGIICVLWLYCVWREDKHRAA